MISLQIVPVSQQLVRARTYKVCKVKLDTGGQVIFNPGTLHREIKLSFSRS